MIFRFDRYTLNSETRTLSCGDSTVTLTPKVFQTLLVLVENHARVMSKDELFEHIWPHQTVEEANLTQNISMLRKALEAGFKDRKLLMKDKEFAALRSTPEFHQLMMQQTGGE